MKCPHCNGSDTVKNGKSAKGNQRYWCVSCQRTFQDAPKDARSKATLTVEQMRSLRAEGKSNAAIARLAGVSRERIRQLLAD